MHDIENMLELNNAHAIETGPLTCEELALMLETAFYRPSEGDGRDGMLIAFDQDAPYTSPNFLWFKSRYSHFVYVDRIIVAGHARGRGIARQFYQDLFDHARHAGHERIVCEVNIDPPNPGSLSFHTALGFVALDTAVLENGKTVQYMERRL